jgi:WD40 repeat protein
MKLLITLAILFFSLKGSCQSKQRDIDCRRMLSEAQRYSDSGYYEASIKKLSAVAIHCPELTDSVNQRLVNIYTDINNAKKNEQQQRVLAMKQTEIAVRQNSIAQSRYYSIVAQRLQENDPELAELISVEAYKIYPTDEAYAMLLNISKLRPQLQAMLHKHNEGYKNATTVTGVAFNDSDDVLISTGKDGFIKFWDIKEGKESRRSVAVFPNGMNGIDGMSFCNHRQLVAVYGMDSAYQRSVRIIDYKTGRFWSKNFTPPDFPEFNASSSVLLSKNGKKLFVGSTAGKIYIWNISVEEPVCEDSIEVIPKEERQNLFSKGLASMCLSEDNRILFSGDGLGFVKCWEIASGKEIITAPKKHGAWMEAGEVIHADVCGLALDRKETIIASGGSDGKIKIWDIHTGMLKDSLFIPELKNFGINNVQNIIFPADSDSLLSAIYSNGRFIVWDWKHGIPVFSNFLIDWHTSGRFRSTIAYNKNLQVLAASRDDGQISIWKIANGQQTGNPLTGHIGEINRIDFLDQGSHLISAGADGTIRFWDLQKQKQLTDKVIIGQNPTLIARDAFSTTYVYDPVNDMAIDKKAGLLYIAPNLFEGLVVFDLKRQRISDSVFLKTSISQILFNEKKRIFAITVNEGEEVRLYHAGITGRYKKMALEDEGIKKVLFKPNSDYLYLLSQEGILYAYNTGNNKVQRLAGDSSFHITNFFFNKSGSLMAAVIEEDFDIYLYNNNFRRLSVSLTGHEDEVSSIDFHPFKNILVSSGTDGTIRLWSLDTYLELGKPFTGHETSQRPGLYSHDTSGQLKATNYLNATSISSLIFSDDGKFLISGGSDGTIRYWTIDPAELIRGSLKRSGRKLEAVERNKYFGQKIR